MSIVKVKDLETTRAKNDLSPTLMNLSCTEEGFVRCWVCVCIMHPLLALFYYSIILLSLCLPKCVAIMSTVFGGKSSKCLHPNSHPFSSWSQSIWFVVFKYVFSAFYVEDIQLTPEKLFTLLFSVHIFRNFSRGLWPLSIVHSASCW